MFKLIVLLVLGISDCSKTTEPASGTIEYFRKYLKADMTYTQVVATFGQPDDDTGSGIHIYAFNSKDGTRVRIGYVSSILYARHVDSSGNLLETIIESQ